MSGYNVDTGIFELTPSKIRSWLRRPTLPEGFQQQETYTEGIAEIFRCYNIEVVKISVGGGWMHVRATPEQVWEALSDQPSSPERASYYYHNSIPQSEPPMIYQCSSLKCQQRFAVDEDNREDAVHFHEGMRCPCCPRGKLKLVPA